MCLNLGLILYTFGFCKLLMINQLLIINVDKGLRRLPKISIRNAHMWVGGGGWVGCQLGTDTSKPLF